MKKGMKKVYVSNVCRVDLPQEVLDLAKPGMVEIPPELLAPRQLRWRGPASQLDGPQTMVEATLKCHRGSLVATISRRVAKVLVEAGTGEYEPQLLLSYTRKDYLKDPDVIADVAEYGRAAKSDAELIVVAVVGNNQSPLTVVRNIVSGCQKLGTIMEDAEGALDAANVLLIED
jgi:hypothetical protein